MRTLTVAMVLLAGLSARADDGSRKGDVEQMRVIADYYARAGRPASAEYTRQAADLKTRAGANATIFVPLIKSERLSRAEAASLTESLMKAIERDTRHKVVGTPEEADLILDATLKPMVRLKR